MGVVPQITGVSRTPRSPAVDRPRRGYAGGPMPATEAQLQLEARARAACEQGNFDEAATRLIEAYGGDLLRFLCARLSDASAASDVYSEVVERLWRSLPRFEWRFGARAYCYAIARNTAINYVSAAD